MSLPINKPDMIAVIRSVGERTFEACRALLLTQLSADRVFIVQERPFEAALRKTYEIGVASGVKWMLTIDADVLLCPDAVRRILSEAENMPDRLFQFEGFAYDKITGKHRNVGHRLYRVRWLNKALQHIPPPGREIRPEYATLQIMEKKGFPSLQLGVVMGVHDYEQYYRDIYRKTFIYASKHHVWLSDMIKRCKNLAPHDNDFQVALHGLQNGLLSLDIPRIDAAAYIIPAKETLAKLGICEKPAMHLKESDRQVADILDNAGPPPLMHKLIPTTMKEQAMQYFHQLGLFRLGFFIFGSALIRIGAKIKIMSMKSKHNR